MKRILLFSGKGGVGKTTIAAASGLAAAQHGHKTLVLSFDIAHSLADAFGLERSLFDQSLGQPVDVAPGLRIQEIDVQEEIETHWRRAGNAFAVLLAPSGVNDATPEDLALMPGLEDLITLLHLNRNARATDYDVLILDCPPTGDSLRFVSLPRTIEWYLRKRFGFRPSDLVSRGDSGLAELRDGIAGVDTILQDTATTSVRLVGAPESMVMRETQRAYMYFNLYGLATEMLIINRVFPDTGAIAAWRKPQEPILARMHEIFDAVRIVELPYLSQAVQGRAALENLASRLYGTSDPTETGVHTVPFRMDTSTSEPRILVAMPFADRREVHLHREAGNLIVRVGSFKRHIPLPRNLQQASISEATISEGNLAVTFVTNSQR